MIGADTTRSGGELFGNVLTSSLNVGIISHESVSADLTSGERLAGIN
jgi:hypothetical protein